MADRLDIPAPMKKLSYAEFVATVTIGRKNNTTPSFRQNKNVMCHLDNIY